MNVMTRFTIKSLRANRVRTLVTIAGVALAAALLTAVLTSYTSLNSMLYRGEAYFAGTWMAEVHSDEPDLFAEQARKALDEGKIAEVATIQDVGFAELTPAQQNMYGEYLPITTISGDVSTLCAIRPSEGRLPQAPGEIMLFATWAQSDDQVQLGDQITFSVGQRQAVLAPGESGDMTVGSVAADQYDEYTSVNNSQDIAEGTLLDSSIDYLDAERGLSHFNEQLTEVQERTYTVVGFYDEVNFTARSRVGMYGYTCGETTDRPIFGFMTMEGVSNSKEVKERAVSAFPEDGLELHTGMLRYMGISTGGAIWDTFFGIVAVLAVVIVVACISLIYNAFAISVAERSGQFGLLASVGASRRQLRRAVVVEALLVALIGIPLGLLLGIGGCAVTFAFLGPSISSLLGATDVGFKLAVEPLAVAFAAILTLITVLVSVFIPSWRVSRIDVIDALRGRQDKRASRRGASRAAKAVNSAKLWKRKGLAGRVFGMGGQLARINEKRGASKGTAASVSLALAIVLLMTAGSVSVFVGTLANVVSGGGSPAGDVAVVTSFASPHEEAHRSGEKTGDAANGVGSETAKVTLDEAVAAADARFAGQAAVSSEAYGQLELVPDAQGVGWRLDVSTAVSMDPSMVGEKLKNPDGGMGSAGLAADGQFVAYANIVFLDDESFDSFARQEGLDPADYHDSSRPRAIGIGQAYGTDGEMYRLLDSLVSPGVVQVPVAGVFEGREVDGFTVASQSEGGEVSYAITPYLLEDDEFGEDRMEQLRQQTELATMDLDVGAIVQTPPSLVGQSGETIQLILPVSQAVRSFGAGAPSFRAAFDAPEGRSAEVAQALVDSAGAFFHEVDDYQTAFLSVNDYVSERNQNQMLATVVNVFCLLFTVILALIALANVFNTVTNGLILRRREFAVMRSVGLSDKQFHSMIVDECMAWGLRGLVPGIAISVGVSYLLYRQVALSLEGMPFALPWTYVLLSVGLTAVAIVASVAYGMHRCKADNLVEALRADSI